MTPRVTVLMAVHNGLPWVREAVDSVLEQTFTDFELLVVDDASTDTTLAALESYDDPRIRILRNERNIGQVPSLNRGLTEARGAYVARLDADDRMLPGRLARQVAVLDVEPSVALVGTWMDVVDETGRLWAELRGHVGDFAEYVYAILRDRYPFAHPSIMFRREIVLALGGYDETLAPSEDKDLFRRLALARQDARSIDEPLVLYRRHEGQLSHTSRNVQERHDHAGQERFIAELAPGAPAGALRMLLAGDPAAWEVTGDLAGALAALVAGAENRLKLREDEARKLERLIGARAARVACEAWRAGAAAQWRASPPVFGFGAAHGGLAVAPAYALAVVLGPPAGPLLRALRRAAAAPSLAGVRRRARRSGALRRLYARLPGR